MRQADGCACGDQALLNDWHVVADEAMPDLETGFETRLLGVRLRVISTENAQVEVKEAASGELVRSRTRYGFVFACLGEPERDIVPVPEAEETDRYLVTGGSIAINASGLRAVENFLDMGHFPFVHTDLLGAEPHTEVLPYNVAITEEGEVLTTECRFYQPVASPNASGGMMVDYIYKVIRPYTVALYKSNPVRPDRLDVIVLFVQPVDEENCVAHPFLAYLKDEIDEVTIRWFMQLIFAQDKPILENQMPKRLRLDPGAETPIRADASSIYYRRWLRQRAITYGAIPARA